MLRKAFLVPRISFALMLLFSGSFQSLLPAAIGESREDEAALSLVDAEDAVTMAYLAALKAEGAGANVTDLLDSLNEAGVFLSRANIAFRLGNFDEAVSFASLSENIGVEVQNDAVQFGNTALSESLQRRVFAVTESIIGVVLTVLLSLLGWRIFKKRYFRRVLTMKPEMVSYGS